MHKSTLIIITLSTLIFADYSPVLSPTGKQRVKENLETLDKNISVVTGNIVNCRKNASVLEDEIKELSQIEQEHLKLREKYKEQLANTEKEIEKNNIAIKELDEFLKTLSKNTSASNDVKPSKQEEDSKRALTDKLEREKWNSETKIKLTKINELVQTVNLNIASIDKKKVLLRQQNAQWIDKEKQYQKMLLELANRKTETSKLLKSQN